VLSMFQKTKFSISLASALVAAICGIPSSMIILSIPLASAQMQLPMSGSTSSTSMVKGVSVTAINATENNKITVNLSYVGNGTATPAVTLVGAAINNKDLNSMMSTLLKGLGNTPSTQGRSNLPAQFPSILTGSNIVNAGWKSPASVTIRLQGNTTTPLHNANLISVQVVPFTG
jgi:hypothetical protein